MSQVNVDPVSREGCRAGSATSMHGAHCVNSVCSFGWFDKIKLASPGSKANRGSGGEYPFLICGLNAFPVGVHRSSSSSESEDGSSYFVSVAANRKRFFTGVTDVREVLACMTVVCAWVPISLSPIARSGGEITW